MSTSILVVDDSPHVRKALRKCLELNNDWRVEEAENGEDAIHLAGRLHPDIILLDFAMPVMNGIEAARGIASVSPESSMLMFTMFASNHLEKLANSVGIRAVVSKGVGGMSAII